MLSSKTLFIVLPAVAGIFFVLGYMLRRALAEAKIGYAEKQAAQIVEDSRKEASNLKKESALESKEQLYKAKSQSEKDAREARELNNLEKRLSQKEEPADAIRAIGEFVIPAMR